MSETFDLRIDSIGAGGDGVGRHNGIVVFVPRTTPGDVARVSALQEDRLMRGRLLEVLQPSPDRVEPPCVHYVHDGCGGCQVQHVSYEAQLREKAGIIRDALTRIGKLTVAAPAISPSEQQWRYRRKLTLALRRREGRWIAGLRRFDAPDEVFELSDCPITDERAVVHWRAVMATEHLLPADRELRGAVRILPSGFSFTLEGARTWPGSADFFALVPAMAELWWHPAGKSRRLLHSRASNDSAGASFTQVNPGMAAQLLEWVVSLATAARPVTAVDAYAGTGDFAASLAAAGTRVTAIERDRDASRVSAARLPEGSRAVAALVEDALPGTLPADVVILNPPRGGVDARVAEALRTQGQRPRALIYVSCNPATLARDIRRMERYRVRSVRGFDMFPQTAHVETVCELEPAA
ncbi:MAG: TRAM domain-containing protein [Gemmatimonadaceae bacterium]